MFSYVFIVGPGRCGSNVVRAMLEGNPELDVFAGEITNFLHHLRLTNGDRAVVNLEHGLWYALNEFLGSLLGDADQATQRQAVIDNLASRRAAGETEIGARDFLDLLCAAALGKTSGKVVLNVAGTSAADYLDTFPGSKVIHMLRNPLTQLNSRYLMRSADINSFGGNFPGTWEFGKAFRNIHDSFRQALAYRDHPSVMVLRMEDLQREPKVMIEQVCRFIGVAVDERNYAPSDRGKAFAGTRAGRATATTAVFVSDEDWSCLTPNDLTYCGKIAPAREFYELPAFPERHNSFPLFLRRQLGFYGRKRTRTRSAIRFLKVLLIAFPQYIQDLGDKHYFDGYLEQISGPA